MSITYTEELQSSINNSNNQFIQEEYDLDHANNAAKISLYYAHGETEKNGINYRNSKIDEKRALSLDNQAVQGINLATNSQTAAKQSLVDAGKATSNISTAAANMQIAANAITKLSSDVAGILAVANAADHGSQIQNSVARAHSKIRKAAKLAEEVSLVSLNATIEAAQSTASTVVTDSQLTVASMTNFQKSTAAQYSNTSAKAVASNEGLTAARKNEKVASGHFDITKKQDKAIKSTRRLINKVSNYGIQVFDPARQKDFQEDTAPTWAVDPGKSYTISFNKFEGDGIKTGKNVDPAENAYVQYYRLIMVKYDASASFDINVAKDLDPGTYYQIPAKGYDSYARTFYLLGTDQALIPQDPGVAAEKDPKSLNSVDSKHVRGIAIDYTGKPVEAGEYYVAYVYAVYTDAYQKLISNTDGFLSLPSKDLQLQMNLPKIPQNRLEKAESTSANLLIYNPVQLNSRNLAVQFEVYQKDYTPDFMEYRVMLVEKRNVDAQTLNKKVQAALNRLDKAEYQYNIEKQKLQSMNQALNRLEIEFNSMQTQVEELEAQKVEVTDQSPDYVVAEQDALGQQLDGLNAKLKANRANQKQLETAIYGGKGSKGQQQVVAEANEQFQNALSADAALTTEKVEKNVSDFIFDTDLMNTVTAANYYAATPFKWSEESAKEQQKEAKENLKLAQLRAADAIKDYAFYNFDLKQAQSAVQTANNKVNEMNTALNKAESDLDEAEMKGSDLTGPINELNKARTNLQEAEATLSSKKIALEVIESNKSVGLTGLQAVLDNYVTASSTNKRAGEIADLSKQNKKSNKGASSTNEIVLFYTEVGEDATDNYGEPLQFNDISYWKTTLDILEELWRQEAQQLQPFFDKMEELQQNLESNLKKEALMDSVEKATKQVYADIVNTKDLNPYVKRFLKRLIQTLEVAEDEVIDKTKVDEIMDEILLAILKAILEYQLDQDAEKIPQEVADAYLKQEKVTKVSISYQAIVLTTITSDDDEVVNQYKLQSSEYSQPAMLWGVVE